MNRGLKTLALRMKAHSENAQKIAQNLENHPAIERVIYPGLRNHPQYNLGKKLSPKGFPGMICIQLKITKTTGQTTGQMTGQTTGQMTGQDRNFEENRQRIKIFVSSLNIFTLAVSLGAVESLVDVPVMMTQGCNGVSEESLQERGINIGLIRLSIGIEDVDDLIDDLNQALDKYYFLFVNNVTFQNNGTLVQEKVNGKVNGRVNGKVNGNESNLRESTVVEMLKRNLSRTKLSSNETFDSIERFSINANGGKLVST